MTFKLNSISKIFFTYFCPRFYGGAPSTPANTTSTTTVNQSPWQNPVYQALMLGTADNPGPITSMLNNNKALMAQYNAINTNGLPAAQQASLGSWNPAGSPTASYVNQLNTATGRYVPTANPALTPATTSSPVPTQAAAQGGIMGLKGYASGSTATTDTSAFINDTFQNLLGRPASQADLNYWTPQIDNGTISRDQFTAQTKTAPEAIQYAASNPTIAASAKNNSPYTLTDTLGKTAYFDPTTGQTTNPGLLQLQQEAKNLSNPAVMDTGVTGLTQAYNKTQALANYNPSQVTTNKADVANANAATYNAANANAASYNAANANAASYNAANMAAPANISANNYTAAQMANPSNVSANKADVAQMQGAANISADQLQQYQMQGPQAITAPTATAAQMAGPQSWLAQGTAQAYMNPYQQAVTDQALYEANRQYQQQLNQLNAQAVGANAYGGSRQAIQQAEAARNNAINQAAIENTGLSNAYTQGTQQFNTAQGQQLQAGQANLGASQQTSLANQAAQIQAMMANQGMDFNTALQNLQAKLGVQNTQSAQDLQAAVQNQNTQQQTQMTNMAAQNVANNNYAAQQLAAAQGNQQAGLTTAQQNMAATNTAQQSYVQQQLAAAQANQSTALTAAQQNQIAANAAAQYNAGNQQNVNLANQQAANTASQYNAGNQQNVNLANQQAANTASQYNAGNQQATNLANQQAANTANNAYTQNALTASQANQTAGLSANQQDLSAQNQAGNIATAGVNAGSAQNAATLANMQAQGAVAQATQGLAQSYLDQQSANATNWLNAPNAINSAVVNSINAQPTTGGTAANTSTSAPAAWARGGLIKNGKVSKRGNA